MAPNNPYLFLDKSPMQTMLATLGKYILGIEVSHSTGKPQPVLKLLFPTDWLISADICYVVEAYYFSNEETLYFIGSDPGNNYIYLDDLVKYADGIIKYNDAVEAKRLELEELLRQKEIILVQAIREHREKMEAEGVQFRTIVPKHSQATQKPISINLAKVDPREITTSSVQNINYNEPIPFVAPRKPAPEGFDPSIFSEDDEPVDPRELMPAQQSKEYMQPAEEGDYNPQHQKGGNGGLSIVNAQPIFNRDQVIMQRHDRDDNY